MKIVLHEEPIVRRFSIYGVYYGILVPIVLIILAIVLPFVIAFICNILSKDIWLTHSTYLARPSVTYLQKAIFILGDLEGNQKIWTSSGQINNLIPQSKFFFPDFQYRATIDPKEYSPLNIFSIYGGVPAPDEFNFKIRVPIDITSTQSISNVQLLLFFNYQIGGLNLESLAHVSSSWASSASSLLVQGDMVLRQNGPHNIYVGNYKPIPSPSVDFTKVTSLDQIQINNLINQFYSQPFTTTFTPHNVVWNTGKSEQFQLEVKIALPIQPILYTPGILEVFKSFWIQYFSFLLPIAWICYQINRLIVLSGILQLRETISTKKFL